MIEEETIRLDPSDGRSVQLWVERMKSEGYFVDLKGTGDAPPAGSSLASDAFVLIIQTKYQKHCWEKWGSRYAAMDATHNTTHYVNMSLFTLMAGDDHGHGKSSFQGLFRVSNL